MENSYRGPTFESPIRRSQCLQHLAWRASPIQISEQFSQLAPRYTVPSRWLDNPGVRIRRELDLVPRRFIPSRSHDKVDNIGQFVVRNPVVGISRDSYSWDNTSVGWFSEGSADRHVTIILLTVTDIVYRCVNALGR